MTGPHPNLTETASDAAIDTACRVLRLPTMRAQFPDLVARAEREQFSYRGFLAELLMSECEGFPAVAHGLGVHGPLGSCRGDRPDP